MTLNHSAGPWFQRNLLEREVFQDVGVPYVSLVSLTAMLLHLKVGAQIESVWEEKSAGKQFFDSVNVGLLIWLQDSVNPVEAYQLDLGDFKDVLSLKFAGENLLCHDAKEVVGVNVYDSKDAPNSHAARLGVFDF